MDLPCEWGEMTSECTLHKLSPPLHVRGRIGRRGGIWTFRIINSEDLKKVYESHLKDLHLNNHLSMSMNNSQIITTKSSNIPHHQKLKIHIPTLASHQIISITSNYNIESMPTKHEVASSIFRFYIS